MGFLKEAVLVPCCSMGGAEEQSRAVFLGADLPGVSARAPVTSDISHSSSITWSCPAHAEFGAGGAVQLCGCGFFTVFAQQLVLEVTLGLCL